jgi:hypothetical protein
MAAQSVASRFLEKLLAGTVDSVVRAGAKAVESLAGDARKALSNEAKRVELLQQGVKMWREYRVGEIEDLGASEKAQKETRQ